MIRGRRLRIHGSIAPVVALGAAVALPMGCSRDQLAQPAGGSGGATGGGGETTPSVGPCDIYATDGGPCVAAHSTVRALLGAYNGHLYQVRPADGQLKGDKAGANHWTVKAGNAPQSGNQATMWPFQS